MLLILSVILRLYRVIQNSTLQVNATLIFEQHPFTYVLVPPTIIRVPDCILPVSLENGTSARTGLYDRHSTIEKF
jgi:hypothetical protein